MKNLFFAAFIIGLFGITGMLQGCYKDSIQPTVKPYVHPTPIDTTDTTGNNDTAATVHFSVDIQPVFTSHCVLCHSSGGTSPDLTAGNAYNNIINGGLVNTASPSASTLYLKLQSGTMVGYSPSGFDDKVLTWITEGAHNN